MRALSARLAATCETAKSRRCRCRCGGLLHGAGRFTAEDEARELDEADPHHAADPRDRRIRRAIREAGDSIEVAPAPDLRGLVQAELFDPPLGSTLVGSNHATA